MNRVPVARLKARLSAYLRAVRRGRTVLVVSRDVPVARLVPVESAGSDLVIRRPLPGAPRPQAVPLPPPLHLDVDIVELLLAERQAPR